MFLRKKSFIRIFSLILLLGAGIFVVTRSPLLSYFLQSSSIDSSCTAEWYKKNVTKYNELLGAQEQTQTLLEELEDSLASKNAELQEKNDKRAQVRIRISQDTTSFQNTFSSPGTALPSYTATCATLTAFNRAKCHALKAIEEKKNLFKQLNNEVAQLKSSIKKIIAQKNKAKKTLSTLNEFIKEYETCGQSLEGLTLLAPNGGEIVQGKVDIQWKGGINTTSGITLELRDANGDYMGIIAKNQLPNSHYLWDGKTACGGAGTSNTCTLLRDIQPGKYIIIVSGTNEKNTKIIDESDELVTINQNPENDTQLSSLDVIAPTEVNVGEAFDVTIRSLKQDRTILTSYRGTVQVSSLYGSEGDLSTFRTYTFTTDDVGAHYFAKGITIKKAGKYMLRFYDESAGKEAKMEITAKSQGGTTTGTLEAYLIDAPSSVNINQPFTLTVKALKEDGSLYSGYRGTVSFVIIPTVAGQTNIFDLNIPWTYTYLTTDNGSHTFPQAITIKSAGEYTISVYDQVTNINHSVTVTAREYHEGV